MDDRPDPSTAPPVSPNAAGERQFAHVTGMSAEAARAYMAYHCGFSAPPEPEPEQRAA